MSSYSNDDIYNELHDRYTCHITMSDITKYLESLKQGNFILKYSHLPLAAILYGYVSPFLRFAKIVVFFGFKDNNKKTTSITKHLLYFGYFQLFLFTGNNSSI